jgi:hypothetical protein
LTRLMAPPAATRGTFHRGGAWLAAPTSSSSNTIFLIDARLRPDVSTSVSCGA